MSAKEPFPPLHGIRVLDFSRILAGPWATQLLADFGADVVKVEKPGAGDDTRQWGPPFLTGANDEEVAGYFLACNRGKRSVAVDFSHPDGQKILRDLAERSDVLVENFKPGKLARYELDYASLRAVNPKLVYCSITGFGQTGRNAQRPGYDAMIQAEAGLMSLTGTADGEPMKVGIAVSDLMCGMYAASAIQAALLQRAVSGRGQHIDLALFDTQVAWLANQGMNYLLTGAPPRRHGNAHPNIAPYQTYASKDGYLMVAVGNDGQFRSLCDRLCLGSLGEDARFANNAARVENRGLLESALAPVFAQRATRDWLSILAEAGIPAGPVNDLDAVFAHPQLAARELRFAMTHDELGELPQIANPVKFSAASSRACLPPPRLGEHTAKVLEEIGIGAAERLRLAAAGAIG